MRPNYFFYDLETSGLNARDDRIMQFAGQRTDLDFNPLGDPINLLIEVSNDTLPSPQAIMVTGITPQACNRDGLSERDFCRFVVEDMAAPNTIITGYNSIRFDDEFMRHALWRNFYDAYAWQWRERQSRWDLLDVVRMTRALRPEGINWPISPDGQATNRLELITKMNNISHQHAHDALSDVEALISVTKLIREKQPQLFNYLLKMRSKREVKKLVNLKEPKMFVYSSGRYPGDFDKTTVCYPIAKGENDKVLVYDLRYDPADLLAMEQEMQGKDEKELYEYQHQRRPLDDLVKRPNFRTNFFPIVKSLQYNRCPAVAPIGVLEKDDGWAKIKLTKEQVESNLKKLYDHPTFLKRVIKFDEDNRGKYDKPLDPESALYDSFVPEDDKINCAAIRSSDLADLKKFHPSFKDKRLAELLLHYKARQFPGSLSDEEAAQWEQYRAERLNRQRGQFVKEMQMIENTIKKEGKYLARGADDCAYLLEELSLWYQSLLPEDL